MTLRCDHCRRTLGLMVHRYWRMRFCSTACIAAYQRRLHDDTKQKIADIRDPDSGHREQPRLADRLFAGRAGTEPAKRLAG